MGNEPSFPAFLWVLGWGCAPGRSSLHCVSTSQPHPQRPRLRTPGGPGPSSPSFPSSPRSASGRVWAGSPAGELAPFLPRPRARPAGGPPGPGAGSGTSGLRGPPRAAPPPPFRLPWGRRAGVPMAVPRASPRPSRLSGPFSLVPGCVALGQGTGRLKYKGTEWKAREGTRRGLGAG